MNREEVKGMFSIIKAVYPSFQKDVPRQTISKAIDLWTVIFADDDAKLVIGALHSYISTDSKGFPPSPGQIKDKMFMISAPDEMSEVEAWGYVKKAISNGAYGAEKEHEKLPEVIKEIVSPEQINDWAMTDLGAEQVIASNFMRSYRAKVSAKREFDKLPQTARALRGETYEDTVPQLQS